MMEQLFFAALHQNKEIAKASSSGGAFTAITDAWFSRYGNSAVVYGCVLDENLKATHVRADDPETRNQMRGSKYIGSDMSGVMRMVAVDLTQGRNVLFSGTPCQIGGLRSFLSVKNIQYEDRLLTVEVICHGVGSVRFFEDYIKHLERQYHGKAVECNFRAKSRPGKKQDMKVVFENGKRYHAASTKYDWFYSGYLKNYVLRPSCFRCQYACRERIADISLADHWGDSKGDAAERSLVVVNTYAGLTWLEAVRSKLQLETIGWKEVSQPNMLAASRKPEQYDVFWDCYRKEGYLSAQKLLGNNTAKGFARSMVVRLLYCLHIISIVKYCREYLKSNLRKR